MFTVHVQGQIDSKNKVNLFVTTSSDRNRHFVVNTFHLLSRLLVETEMSVCF